MAVWILGEMVEDQFGATLLASSWKRARCICVYLRNENVIRVSFGEVVTVERTDLSCARIVCRAK